MYIHGNLTTLVSFIGYLVIVIGVGVIACFVTRNLSDYVLGGRRLGGAVAALSAGASDMSSWLLLGLPGAVYLTGMKQIWVPVGLIVGAYLNWKLIAKPLRVYSEALQDALTIPAYLDNRFQDDSKQIRIVSALAILVFFIFYIASGLVAGALLVSRTFGLEYLTALQIASAIIMLYTLVGGFLAVSWTDFFQGTLMFFCLLLVPFFVHQGNVAELEIGFKKIVATKPHYFQVMQGLKFIDLVSLLGWGLGYVGMPHILVRFMSVKSIKEIPLARTICMWWMSLSMVGAILTGIVGAANFCNCPLDNHETVFMALSEQTLTPWLMGIIMAAILSSSMCAIDSQMLAASSALTEDFYRALFRRSASQKELVWIGRIAVVMIAIVSFLLALRPSETIMALVSFAWAGLGATFGPTVVLSLFWKRMTKNGAVIGMIVGGGTVIVWRLFGFNEVLYGIVPGFLLSLCCVVVVSLQDTPPTRAVLEMFDKVHCLLKNNQDYSIAALNQVDLDKSQVRGTL